MVPQPAEREKRWREHCPGSTVVTYNHPSGRTSYTYLSASGKTRYSWRACLVYMMDVLITSTAPTKLERGPSLYMLWTAKREYRARVWEEKGGQVFNNTYKRDNLPQGQLCVLYVSPEGKKFRSWKQCVRYMGEDPLESVSWKDMSSNGEETNPSTAGANYIQSTQIQALPWRHVDGTHPSSPGEKGSLSGDRSVVQKSQTLNVISSSSSSEGSRDQKAPFERKQAIISISSSKEIENDIDGSSPSSTSESSDDSIQATAAANSSSSALSSSSSEELEDREDADKHMIRLPSGPTQDSVEKPHALLPSAREEDHTIDLPTVRADTALLLLNSSDTELARNAGDTTPTPQLPPKFDANAALNDDGGGGVSAGEADCRRKNPSEQRRDALDAAAIAGGAKDNPATERANSVQKRKVHEGSGESLTTKTKTRGKCRAVAHEPLSSLGPRPCRFRAQVATEKENNSDSQEDQSSEHSGTSLKELLWKTFEDAIKRRKSFAPRTTKSLPKTQAQAEPPTATATAIATAAVTGQLSYSSALAAQQNPTHDRSLAPFFPSALPMPSMPGTAIFRWTRLSPHVLYCNVEGS